MLDVIAITGPICVAILVGFAATRAGMFERADMRVLGTFVYNLALPALLFNALSQRPLREILNAGYLLAYLAGSLAVLCAGYFGARRIGGLGATAASIRAMGMTCANSGFVGYPILLLTLAPVAGVVLALNMIVENLVLIPLLLALAERVLARAEQWRAGQPDIMSPALALEMSAEATRDPAIAAAILRSDRQTRDGLAGWLARPVAQGGLGLAPDVAASRALLLQCFVEGLAVPSSSTETAATNGTLFSDPRPALPPLRSPPR